MTRLAVLTMMFAAALEAQDAAAVLAKARTAFLDNREREHFWTWTTVTERSIVDKAGKVLESLPSVTVESPIRSDGKRCNAVLAWGDGLEPYLANASADERCKVEQEVQGMFRLEALFDSRQVRVVSRDSGTVVLAIAQDKALAQSTDPVQHCMSAMKGTVQLDAASSFPRRIRIEAVTDGCMLKQQTATDHYQDDALVKNVNSGVHKGSVMEFDYELQKDKSGDSSKDFWVCVRRQTTRPWQKTPATLLVYGRRLQTTVTGSDRSLTVKGTTTASELSAQSLVKFDTGK